MKSFLFTIAYLIIFSKYVFSGSKEICRTSSQSSICNRMLFGDENVSTCSVTKYIDNSTKCQDMEFGPITEDSSLGSLRMEPYNSEIDLLFNRTIMKLEFSAIRWERAKFRFRLMGVNATQIKNHCRTLQINNSVIVPSTAVYSYDCAWSRQNDRYMGYDYILDYEFESDNLVNRGQLIYTVPNYKTLEEDVKFWEPFFYIEKKPGNMTLRILPSPRTFKNVQYTVKFIREWVENNKILEEIHFNGTILSRNDFVIITIDSALYAKVGQYFFSVDTTINNNHTIVKISPIVISNEYSDALLTWICILSVMIAVTALLLVFYIFKLPKKGRPASTMVIAQPTVDVINLIKELRDGGFTVFYQTDIDNTIHRDPDQWYDESLPLCDNVIYIITPPEEETNKHTHPKLVELQLHKLTACQEKKQIRRVIFDGAVDKSNRLQLYKKICLPNEKKRLKRFLNGRNSSSDQDLNSRKWLYKRLAILKK